MKSKASDNTQMRMTRKAGQDDLAVLETKVPSKLTTASAKPPNDPFYARTSRALRSTQASVSFKNQPHLPGKISTDVLKQIEFVDMQEVHQERQLQLSQIEQESHILPFMGNTTDTVRTALEKGQVEQLAADETNPLNQLLAKQLLDDEDTFREIPHSQYSNVLYLNGKTGRSEQAESVLKLMEQNDIEPTLDDYNCLLNAYATANDLPGTFRVFKKLMESTELKLKPNEKSYGIVIKCLVQHGRLNDAFQMYTHMKAADIPVTQPIYTTLLKACTKAGDIHRAFRLFDFMKMTQHRPDSITYSHMIHACAKRGWTERAFRLFEEMIQAVDDDGSPLIPLDSTFTALIHACARRPEFYQNCFDLVKQMQDAGHSVSPVTYDYLLMACAYQGDVWRARALVSEMRDKKMELSKQSVNWLMSSYATVPKLIYQLWHETIWRKRRMEWERKFVEAKMGLDNEERLKEGLRPIDINDWATDDEYDPDIRVQWHEGDADIERLRNYVLAGKSESDTLDCLYQEGVNFFKDLIGISPPGSISNTNALVVRSADTATEITTSHLNSYINFLGAFNRKKEAVQVYETAFESAKAEPDLTTYARLVVHLFRPQITYDQDPSSTQIFSAQDEDEAEFIYRKAWSIFEDYEQYRVRAQLPDRWDDLETKFVRNKWIEKRITHQHRRLEYSMMVHMIQGLTRYDDLERALKVLNLCVERGHARITEMVRVKPDTYSPLLVSITPAGHKVDVSGVKTSHPKHNAVIEDGNVVLGLPEVDTSLLQTKTEEGKVLPAESDAISNLLGSLSAKLKLKEHASEEPNDDRNPTFLKNLTVRFRREDFVCLLKRARELQRDDIVTRVNELLEKAEKE